MQHKSKSTLAWKSQQVAEAPIRPAIESWSRLLLKKIHVLGLKHATKENGEAGQIAAASTYFREQNLDLYDRHYLSH